MTCYSLRQEICAHYWLEIGYIQCTPCTAYTLYSEHQAQQQPVNVLLQNHQGESKPFGAACVCPLLIACSSAALLLATMEGTVLRPGLCCVCAEAGASDLHQAHLLPVSAAAAKPAFGAKWAHHVVDSHSACHLGCWRRACSAGGCCHHSCFGQPYRSSNSHTEHCRTARYAAHSKLMCVSLSDKVLGSRSSMRGGSRYAWSLHVRSSRQKPGM